MGHIIPLPGCQGAAPTQPIHQGEVEPLLRESVGRQLRTERQERGERLVDTAAVAGVSPQYLSEIERGRKDPSSEVLAAIAGALDLTVADLLWKALRPDAVSLTSSGSPYGAAALPTPTDTSVSLRLVV